MVMQTERENAGEVAVRVAEEVDPIGEAALPRSFAFYEAQADAVHGQGPLEDALADALHDVILTPSRYAELMQLIDSWLVQQYVTVVDQHFDGFNRAKGDMIQ